MMTETETAKHRGRVMRHSISTSASPADVWRAWTEPATLAQWFPTEAGGRAVSGATLELRWPEFGVSFPYRVIEAKPLQRLLLECDLRGAPGYVLEITLRSHAGSTVVELVASGFGEGAEWDDEYAGTDSGWRSVLAALRYFVENRLGQDRRVILLSRMMNVAGEVLLRDFVMGDGLASWLVQAGTLGAVGAGFKLLLRDGSPFSGRVLADTPREIPIVWNETDSLVTAMVMPKQDGRSELFLHVSGWGWDEGKAEAVKQKLSHALDRLAGAVAG